MKRGRKPTIGAEILAKTQFYRTVAELAAATGAKPHTVRDVLRRASDRGEIVLKRFVRGKSGRAMKVSTAAETAPQVRTVSQAGSGEARGGTELDRLVLMWTTKTD